MKVLVATDLSPHGNLAVDLARSTDWGADTTIRVVTILQPFAGGTALEMNAYALDESLIPGLRKELQGVAYKVKRPGVSVEYEVFVGRPADVIVREAEDVQADLVIVGSRGRGPLATTLLGSVAAEVVDRSPCPVLVARRPALNKIVFAEDGSQGAAEALAYLTTSPMAATFRNVPVQVASVVDTTMPWAASSGIDGYAIAGAYEACQLAVDAQRADLQKRCAATAEVFAKQGLRTTTVTREGHPAAELIGAAEASDGDLIVIGSRGRTGLTRMVLGSVARNVLTHAKCSVLIVLQKTGRPVA